MTDVVVAAVVFAALGAYWWWLVREARAERERQQAAEVARILGQAALHMRAFGETVGNMARSMEQAQREFKVMAKLVREGKWPQGPLAIRRPEE